MPSFRRLNRLPIWLLHEYGQWCARHREEHQPAGVGLNIGTGGRDLPGWINLDETKPGDLLAVVPPIPFRDRAFDEVMLSHVIEHVNDAEAHDLLRECHRVLKPGGEITVVVPDARAFSLAYILGQISNRELNDLYIYSYCQESQHRWSYDWNTLAQLVVSTGFRDIRRISRFRDPRLMAPAWYQLGLTARKDV